MKVTSILALLSLFLLISSFIVASDVYAVGAGTDCGTDGCTLQDPLGFNGDSKAPQKLIGRVINGFLGVTGSLALVMFIYGGFTWMTAAGAAEKVTKGKDIVVWATIGLIVIFSSYAAVNFVFKDILGTS